MHSLSKLQETVGKRRKYRKTNFLWCIFVEWNGSVYTVATGWRGYVVGDGNVSEIASSSSAMLDVGPPLFENDRDKQEQDGRVDTQVPSRPAELV